MYLYNNKKYNQINLIKVLLDYCINNRKRNAFYLSRSIFVVDENNMGYNFSFVFDKNDELKNLTIKKYENKHNAIVEKKNYEVEDSILKVYNQSFDTQEEVIAFLKANPDEHFRILNRKKSETFGMKYCTEDSLLYINNRPFKV